MPDSDYEFTIDMAHAFRCRAEMLFAKFIGKPCSYLEIGVYEGRSGCWALDKVLTHPEARYTGIDSYVGHEQARLIAQSNLAQHKGKPELFIGYSGDVLPKLLRNGEQFDMVYVDGCHSYKLCLLDLVNAWPLLRCGGVMLCDDYKRDDYGVKQAVDEFLGGMSNNEYIILHKDYSIGWEKLCP